MKCQSHTTAICLTQELPDFNEETTIMKNLDVPDIESIERDFLQGQCSIEIEGEEEVADQIEKRIKGVLNHSWHNNQGKEKMMQLCKLR